MTNHTVESAARTACVSNKTIRRALSDRRRQLRHYRIGRRVVISDADLRAWLESHAVTRVGDAKIQTISPEARNLLERLDSAPRAHP